MSTLPIRVLVDTNVWLDNYLTDRTTSLSACEFMDLANNRGIELLYPVHVIKDVYYLIRSDLKRRERNRIGNVSESSALAIESVAAACADNMRQNATAVGADESDVWLAFKYRPLVGDLEDAFVLVAAERAQADMLVTNDRHLIEKATVPAHTPADAALLLRAG